ncbi:MAG: hypothetical protein F4X64_00170 [Chloroflexi bacterium]|nr:hypothetical protein [Chloroflexota bacterium]
MVSGCRALEQLAGRSAGGEPCGRILPALAFQALSIDLSDQHLPGGPARGELFGNAAPFIIEILIAGFGQYLPGGAAGWHFPVGRIGAQQRIQRRIASRWNGQIDRIRGCGPEQAPAEPLLAHLVIGNEPQLDQPILIGFEGALIFGDRIAAGGNAGLRRKSIGVDKPGGNRQLARFARNILGRGRNQPSGNIRRRRRPGGLELICFLIGGLDQVISAPLLGWDRQDPRRQLGGKR